MTAATKLVPSCTPRNRPMKRRARRGGARSRGGGGGAHSRVGRRRRTPAGCGDAAAAPPMLSAERTRGWGDKVEVRGVGRAGESRPRSDARERLGSETRSPGANEASAETAAPAAARPRLGGGGAAAADAEANRRRTSRVPRRAWREVRHVGAGGGGGTGDAFDGGRSGVLRRRRRFLPRTSPSRGSWVASSPPRVRRWRPSLSTTLGSTGWRIRRGTTRGNDSPPGDGTTPPPWPSPDRDHREGHVATAHRGYVVFPFFVDPETGEPPASTAAAAITSRRGMVPVYAATGAWGRVQPRRVLSRPKIPCASMLVRALVATRAETPRTSRSQLRDGAYDSGGCIPRTSSGGCAQVGATRSSRSRGDARPRQANVRAQRSVGDDGTGPRAVDGETPRATLIRQRETA